MGQVPGGLLAATNDLTASQYYRETVRIAVAGDVASAYFRLRAADAELVVLDDTLKLRTDTVKLQRDRFEGGIIGEYDLRTAEAERSAVVADIARAEQAIGQLEAALATLTGRSPRAGVHAGDRTRRVDRRRHRGAGAAGGTAVRIASSGVPTSAAPKRCMAAADLRIQQARANYFPSLTLTGAYGFESAALSQLCSAGPPRSGSSASASCSRCSR